MFCNSKFPPQMHFLFNAASCTSIRCKDLKTEEMESQLEARGSIEADSENGRHGREGEGH